MTKTLLLRLAGPQQSWGSVGSSAYRTTELTPTRSGVEGLLCAALGHRRGDVPEWVNALDILVRVDRAGRVEWDFHTVNPVPDDVAEARGRWAALTGHRPTDAPLDWQVSRGQIAWKLQKKGEDPVTPTMVSRRAYLADAEFLLAVAGPDDDIDRLAAAVRAPVYSPYLGRRAFAPAFPFTLGVRDKSAEATLMSEPAAEAGRLRVVRLEGPRATYVGSTSA